MPGGARRRRERNVDSCLESRSSQAGVGEAAWRCAGFAAAADPSQGLEVLRSVQERRKEERRRNGFLSALYYSLSVDVTFHMLAS
ncbi:hypothetical protein NDU88_006390 [Pleurodeles waltl]|uniref:Uncharacterized protein n=1 Tax=Pleurodeles waltl TaxID=8319 RepID=A0AAV7MEU3_PLEWA|nr:hypothetical protein NDU88_006390 [Pleurodeles waltl]